MNSKDEELQEEPEAQLEAGSGVESLDAEESRAKEMAKKVGVATSEGFKKARPVIVAGARKGAHLTAVGGRKGAHLAVAGASKAKDLIMSFWQRASESDGSLSPEDEK